MITKSAPPANPRLAHAEPQDFCAIFEKDMNALYSLALLLTADHTTAEQCFLHALDDCLKQREVFPDWARSWSRRAIVKQAIRCVNPRPDSRTNAAEASHTEGGDEISDVLRRLMQLPPFERFVFAMSVLERYSVRECAALLNCGMRDVERARTTSLQFLDETGRDLHRAVVAGSADLYAQMPLRA